MGKESLIKSTTKAKKAPPKRKKATAATGKKKPTIKKLTLKKFDFYKPQTIFKIDAQRAPRKGTSAPPIITASDPKEAARLKALLLKRFDLAAPKKAAPKKAAPAETIEADIVQEKKSAEIPADKAQAPIECAPVCREEEAQDPAAKMLKIAVGALIVLMLLVIGASYSNTTNYYIRPTEGAVEIWQGEFAPKGARQFIVLPGVQYPESDKKVYTKGEVYPLIFNYYLEKADLLLDVPGMPDFDGVKSYLQKALAYADTSKLKTIALTRLNSIEVMVLIYKADVAVSKNTIADLEAALNYLKRALTFDLDELQAERINQKITSITILIKDLEAKALAAEKSESAQEQPAQETTADSGH